MSYDEDADVYLTTQDVARVVGGDVSPSTIRLWETSGKLPAIRTLGGQRLFRRGDVDRFLAARRRMKTQARRPSAR